MAVNGAEADSKPAPTPEELALSMIVEEVEWINLESIGLAIDDMKRDNAFDAATAMANYEELKKLCAAGFDGLEANDAKAVENAKRAIELKKDILLSHPLMVGKSIVAAKFHLGETARKDMAPALGTQSNNWTPQSDARRIGFDASIVELSDIAGDVKQREIYAPESTSPISDLRLHWDGDKMIFTQSGEDQRWYVHEVNFDGTGAKRLLINEEIDLDFFDAIYLPDGRIIANSNIGYSGVPCVNGSSGVSNTVIYDPKTQNLRQITFDQDSNWNPVVMNNGRVMYTRWEYTDLTHYYSRIVMHMNPDGTENKALYGSGEMFPNSTYDVQPLPGHSSAFIGVISGHHGIARSGRLILFDPLKGRSGVSGMTQEILHRNRPIKEEIKDRLVDGVWPQFVKPTVVDDKYFLVAAKPSKDALWGIYLVDVFDNMTCIMQSEGDGYISPALVTKKVTPPVIPDRVILGEKEATFFIQDIYEGEGLRGIPRGTIKEVRLHAYEYAYVETKSDHDWQGIQSGWDIKRGLGSVPVEEDGSVIFKAPANTPISIQPIDENGVAVQWMRSWVVGQPGEIVSCIGCHEDQNQIVIPKRVMASQKAATSLTLPEGGIRSFTFDLEIQPILDRACIECHNGSGKAFDLRTGEKDQYGFGPAYINIHPYVRRQGGEGTQEVLQPYEYHPNTSELVRLLKKGHFNVELTDAEWRKIYNWIDYNAPDKGNFNDNIAKKLPFSLGGGEQYSRRIELKNKYAGGMGVDWRAEIADYAAYLESQGEIKQAVREPMKSVKEKEVKVKNWPLSADEVKQMQAKESRETKVVEVAPGVNMTFVRVPAGEFVMGSYDGEPDAYPTSKVKISKGFWMAELETSNEQMRAIFPEHNSMFVDQMWKDHVVQGYVANDPDQPAIRLSQEKAMEYCRILSEKTGLKATLPTEAQWEWACRAGSDSDFWYGDLNSDFSDKENLADKTTLKFAVAGVNPQPMKTNNPKYGHYTFLPKEIGVDDQQLIQVGGKFYTPNAFGLYNMHGNIAEWTRSDYLPYPYTESSKESSEYKVARGGSYYERPKYSTAHTRKYYYPYQPVFNVGFRVILED